MSAIDRATGWRWFYLTGSGRRGGRTPFHIKGAITSELFVPFCQVFSSKNLTVGFLEA
jgi:hypothetical protein